MDWQTHALTRLFAEDPGPALVRDHMFWGRWPGMGPGAEILGDLAGKYVAEIGCGPGHHLAHLVADHGTAGVGIDIAPAQIRRANNKYGHLPGITFTTADATPYLSAIVGRFDVVISIFGALSFANPRLLLPALARSLVGGGRLAFSVRDDRLDVCGWSHCLAAAGFKVQSVDRLIDATLVITAQLAAACDNRIGDP
jgi:SAM-dependent methyltransferase